MIFFNLVLGCGVVGVGVLLLVMWLVLDFVFGYCVRSRVDVVEDLDQYLVVEF